MASFPDRRFVLRASLVALAVLVTTPARAQSFGYFGALGPQYWSQLSPDWGACNSGEIQSPVDLGHQRTWRDLAIDYGTTTGEIFNNGHTIEVETEGDNRLMLDGVTYDLVQFHFHTGSEHRVLGRGYDMELHLVHKSAAGTNAVIGVFLKRGTSSGALAPIFAELPDSLNVKEPLAAAFSPARFLPSSPAHYRYVGSLTTPPCTEGVRWLVLEEPVTVSDEDIAQFAERIHFNARYVQRRVGQFPGR
jgi:carbonic anhydrase